ncbi:MAG TPA: group II truncated hemoglobin [Candidatus Dormibacteraeota bacterium]|jgi:hemoglobin|nr:group II truncated hemoglobin [Candidatus Dormibacteraeota bacterium]
MARPSLFEFAGGDPAIRALTAALHERCLQEPELNHAFSHPGHPQHLEHLAAYLAEVLGGPSRYSESLGGHSGMLGIHAGTGAADDWGARFAACFMQALDDASLPDDADFRAALRAYIDWATDQVTSYSPVGAQVPAALPFPRWGWNGPE